ncbi:MAG: DNA integrity scanning diadenylate cyclase DisA, partial [Actinomycetota bacterium]|nr:DNA integrity scanning diadenylate cyclase DisA [Actinomycetota bacterium]
MVVRPSSAMAGALALVAPGQPLREGLERVLLAKRGALVVVGDDPAVLSICTGGFLFDAEFSPQRLSELAKMDGAIIVSADASRIARANVHLMPSSSIPTTETGTRHRTAERVARSMDVPVVSVSAAMGIVTVYRSVERHVLQPTARLHERVNQALQTLLRFRQRFDVAVATLSVLEVEDTVTVRDVAAVLQPAELAVRIAEEIEIALVELGEEGRLLRLQLEELIDGVDKIRRLVVRDYARQQGPACPVTPADGAAGHRGHGRGQRHAAMSAGGATTVAMAAAGGGASPVASGVSTRRAGSRTPGSGFVTKSGDAPGIDAADGHRRGAGTTDADGAGNTKSGDAPGIDAADGHRRG